MRSEVRKNIQRFERTERLYVHTAAIGEKRENQLLNFQQHSFIRFIIANDWPRVKQASFQ